MKHYFDAGSLCLDFLNTRGTTRTDAYDAFGTPSGVLEWLEASGAVPPSELRDAGGSPPVARTLLNEALRLRGALVGAVESWTRGAGPSSESVLILDRALAARSTVRGLQSDLGRVRLTETATFHAVQGLLAPVAEATARLLSEADPARVRRCAHPNCVRWFLDTTKNGSRRWCSMSRCGNRAKAAAHYRRTRGG